MKVGSEGQGHWWEWPFHDDEADISDIDEIDLDGADKRTALHEINVFLRVLCHRKAEVTVLS